MSASQPRLPIRSILMFSIRVTTAIAILLVWVTVLPAQDKNNTPPPGFKALFNGKDLTGWKGLPLKSTADDKKKSSRPYRPMTMPERLKASTEELAEAQKRGDESTDEQC